MNKKTQELIDKYCTGFELTDAQQDEIFNMVSQMGDNLKEVAEYMQNLLYGLTPEEVKAGKRAKPDSTPIKYTVTIKWIPNLLVGMMATQNVLGWSSAESRKKLSKLPVEAHVTEYWYRAWNIFKKLSRLSIEAEVTAVNNLGQILDNRYAMAVNEIDLYKVKYGRKAGFMDDKGYLVIPCEYRFVEDFKEGLACVTKNGRTGFINKLVEKLFHVSMILRMDSVKVWQSFGRIANMALSIRMAMKSFLSCLVRYMIFIMV